MGGPRNVISGFRVLETPDPREAAFAIDVPDDQIRPDIIPTIGTAYRDCPTSFPKERCADGWGGYKFTGIIERARTPQGFVSFGFAKNKTAAEIADPYRSFTVIHDHKWPAVLVKLEFIPVNTFPLSTTTSTGTVVEGKRYLVREEYVPEYYGPTRFLVELFTSPTQFDIPPPRAPIPTAVSYHFLNVRGGFPECLHDQINIASLVGTSSEGLKGQVFPATNFITWEPYFVEDTQEFVQNVWHRRRVRAFPPPVPETSIATHS